MTRGSSVKVIDVLLWGSLVGKICSDPHRESYAFRYSDDFRSTGIQPSPLMMPTEKAETFYVQHPRSPTFLGLPGMVSDSLPDAFGRKVISRWFLEHSRAAHSFSALDMLAFMNSRAMGALEFRPSRGQATKPKSVFLEKLCEQANALDKSKQDVSTRLHDLITVGSSAGGAKPKAVVCWNPATDELRSGQGTAPEGFEHWLLKLDLVGNDASPLCRIEYAYHLMAKAAGIRMEDCRLYEEAGRAHFMTRRFDRGLNGARHHIQTLCALTHSDLRLHGSSSYFELFNCIIDLGLPYADLEEAFRRMVFNVMARNMDDHTKNIAFLLRQGKEWELAPAYDLMFVYGPGIIHQMNINGKFKDISRQDLLTMSERFSIDGKSIILSVNAALEQWRDYAEMACVSNPVSKAISDAFFRL